MASSKRERELARMRAERQAARRAEAAARRRRRRNAVIASTLAVVVVAVLAVVLTTTLRHSPGAVTAAATPSAAAPTAAPSPSLPPGTCRYPKSSQPASKPAPIPPTTGVNHTTTYTATLTTNRGPIVLALNAAKAPCTVNSFRSLAEAKFFDNTPCHRLTTQGIFVLQCGDPTGKGTGGPGYSFPDENLAGATYPAGTVAMANAGPNTNGSQFFLVYKDTKLPPSYIPFGRITGGMPVIDKIAAAGANPPGDGAPKLPVTIQKVAISPLK